MEYQQKGGFEGELPSTEQEEVLEVGAQHIHDHEGIAALHPRGVQLGEPVEVLVVLVQGGEDGDLIGHLGGVVGVALYLDGRVFGVLQVVLLLVAEGGDAPENLPETALAHQLGQHVLVVEEGASWVWGAVPVTMSPVEDFFSCSFLNLLSSAFIVRSISKL